MLTNEQVLIFAAWKEGAEELFRLLLGDKMPVSQDPDAVSEM